MQETTDTIFIFRPVEKSIFNYLLMNQGNSDEAGQIGSQYEEELKNNHPSVKTLGLYTCETLVSVLSYGLHKLPREKNSVSIRLDSVITLKNLRKNGLSSILISKFFLNLIEEHGTNLKEISTVAVHPAIVCCVQSYGFSPPPQNSKTPRYYLKINSEDQLDEFKQKIETQLFKKLSFLKLKCLKCKSKSWTTAWCGNINKGKI